MKKVKIMLMSIAVLAVVGGALAFKAKYQQTFCFTNTTLFQDQPTCTTDNGVALDCGADVVGKITTAGQGAIGCTAPDDLGCDIQCPDLEFTTGD